MKARFTLCQSDVCATVAHRQICFALFLLALATGCQNIVHAEASDAPLLQKEDLIYEGAFRVPAGGPDTATLNYGGRALALNPERESLFLTGHDHHQRTVEIRIPQVVNSSNIADLETATIIQDFQDATDGRRREINPTNSNAQRIGGHLVFDGKLYVSAYSNYDGRGSQRASHFVRALSLSVSDQTRGPVAVGSRVHFTSAYMALVPPEWQAILGGPALTGNCCRSIIGYQSHGPALSVFDPMALETNDPVAAVDLVYYTSQHPLGPGGTTRNPYFNLTTRVEGVAFPHDTRSVLFFGYHGVGEYCYGESEKCQDPARSSKGTHAYPYVYQVWAYDANDFIASAKGRIPPYRLSPYSIWNFNLPFESDDGHSIGGVAYDAMSGRIYLSQLNGDAKLPVIHVFRINLPEPQDEDITGQ